MLNLFCIYHDILKLEYTIKMLLCSTKVKGILVNSHVLLISTIFRSNLLQLLNNQLCLCTLMHMLHIFLRIKGSITFDINVTLLCAATLTLVTVVGILKSNELAVVKSKHKI